MKRFLLFIIPTLILINGCGDYYPTTEGPIPDPILPDTPEKVIFNLEYSFNTRDIQLYKQCLSPNFTFHFHPDDVGTDVNGYIIPETWGFEDDWNAIQNMFTDAYDISIAIDEEAVGNPGDGATEYSADNIPISLLVMIDENNGFIATAVGSFLFETYDSNGDTYWRIKDWWDGDQNGGGRGSYSIGIIKVLFRDEKPD